MNLRRRGRCLCLAAIAAAALVLGGCEDTTVGVGVTVGYPGPYGRIGGPYGGVWVGGPIYRPF